MSELSVIDSCLACGKLELQLALDLGTQAPANNLTLPGEIEIGEYPLALMYCSSCGHGQLSHAVNPSLLFDTYLYKSGTSGTLINYFEWFTNEVAGLLAGSRSVLEIGANDGSLLRLFNRAGFDAIGVDPATNIANECAGDATVICDYFPTSKLSGRQFELIVGLNVLAHTPDPLRLLQGAKDVLAPNGVCIFQTSQALMLESGDFDTIYHEHFSFFTLLSMKVLAQRAGLRLRQAVLTNIHGVSLVGLLTHPTGPEVGQIFNTEPFALDSKLLNDMQDAWESKSITDIYTKFARKAKDRMMEVVRIVEDRRALGHQVVLVGAAAKAITFARAAGLRPDLVVDEAPDKIGRVIPGLGLEIQSLESIKNLDGQILFVIAAWNFASELERKVRLAAGSSPKEFLVYFPELRTW